MTKSGTQERTILPEKTPVKKASLFIHIKMGYHPITTMREYDQKTGQDPQGIDPTNILPRQYTHK